MPLFKARSQKAFNKNVETEMEHGKPQAQSLAIAYDMKRRSSKKKMAEGGQIKDYERGVHKQAPDLPEGMSKAGQDAKYGHSEEAKIRHHRNLMELRALPDKKLKGLAEGGPVEIDFKHEGKPSIDTAKERMTPKKAPRMAEGVIKAHLLDEYGRKVEQDNLHEPARLEEDDDQIKPPKAEYMAQRFADGEDILDQLGMSGLKHPADMVKNAFQGKTDYDKIDTVSKGKPSPKPKAHWDPSKSAGENEVRDAGLGYADGGMLDEEMEDEKHSSLAAAIMAHKKRKMMAEGGQVDLEENSEEQPNQFYKQNEHEALKENYDQDLFHVDEPKDSNEHGDELSDEDEHDMVSAIRRKMRASKQF